jgi:hypothetical protein
MEKVRRIALVALIAALVVPLFVTAIPPLLDAPKAIAPTDATIALLANLMPPPVAGKILMALGLLLPLLGTVALHDAIFGNRSWWPLTAALVVYNGAFLAGLFDFTVGIGGAMLGAAAWIRWKDRARLQVAAVVLIACAIFVTHALGLFFLVLLVGSFEVHEVRRTRNVAALVVHSAKLGFAMLPVAFLFVHERFAFNGNSPIAIARTMWWTLAKFDPLQAAMGAGAGFSTYDTGIDLLILMAVTAAFAALALAEKLSFSWLTAVTGILMLAYLFASGGIAGANWIDTRLPVVAGFLLIAGITPRKLGRRETAVLVLAFAALIVVRIGGIEVAWQSHNTDSADFVTASTR